MIKSLTKSDPGSFRDPSGIIFEKNDVILRQVNLTYQKQYDFLIKSGLYKKLTERKRLIKHSETQEAPFTAEGAYKILLPEQIPFISYPYEWSFSQLKDAALLTLAIHKESLNAGMILKDASAYNIQFLNGQAILIDSLSFDFYKDGDPWVAYGQFCRHFLAPLLLMSKIDIRLNELLRTNIDGIPLDLANVLLHGKGGFFRTQHISWHTKAIQKHAQDGKSDKPIKVIKIPKFQHIALIDSLFRGIKKLSLKNVQTEWGDYYDNTNYVDAATNNKENLTKNYLETLRPKTVWDLGANDGRYSALALDSGASGVVAFDIDPIAVERNYLSVRRNKKAMLPLVLDITNPSPGIGFANHERKTITDRQRPDCVMALALIHHLAISNNLPLNMLAKWFADICENLIIEFIPKEDSQVEILLKTREDIFPQYTKEDFERTFVEHFTMERCDAIEGSKRFLYLFTSKEK